MYFRRTRHSQLQFGFVTGSPIKSPKIGLFIRVISLSWGLSFICCRTGFTCSHSLGERRQTYSKRGAPDTRHAQRGRRLLLSNVSGASRSLRACLSSPEKRESRCLALSSLNYVSGLEAGSDPVFPYFFSRKSRMHTTIFFIAFPYSSFLSKKNNNRKKKKKKSSHLFNPHQFRCTNVWFPKFPTYRQTNPASSLNFGQ